MMTCLSNRIATPHHNKWGIHNSNLHLSNTNLPRSNTNSNSSNINSIRSTNTNRRRKVSRMAMEVGAYRTIEEQF